jgi:hypothetical protein
VHSGISSFRMLGIGIFRVLIVIVSCSLYFTHMHQVRAASQCGDDPPSGEFCPNRRMMGVLAGRQQSVQHVETRRSMDERVVESWAPRPHGRVPPITGQVVRALLLEAGSATEPLSGRLRYKLLTCSRLLNPYE